MLHFDAHSDLACPMHVPAKLFFQPRQVSHEEGKNLYELLDATSTGVAEWILPLTLAANLRHIDWIRRSSEFEQFACGSHAFHVGVWLPKHEEATSIESFLDLPDTARLRVDLNVPYYRDDAGGDAYVPTQALVLKQHLNLRVADSPTIGPPIDSDQWILDICLDYFCARNPFIVDLEGRSPKVASALAQLFEKSSLKTIQNKVGHYRSFQSALMEFLRTPMAELGAPELYEYFPSHSIAKGLLSDLLSAIDEFQGDTSCLMASIIDAIPYWMLPHTNSIPSQSELHEAIGYMCQRIRLQRCPPLVITLARSAVDEFTPASLVEDLQDQVLEAVHGMYGCGCSRSDFRSKETADCCLDIIYDYGEWEGSSFRI